MITKINARKIKYQLNIKIFVWDYDNLTKKQIKINQILNNITDKKKPKRLQFKKKY
jgi:prephenate dehydratase